MKTSDVCRSLRPVAAVAMGMVVAFAAAAAGCLNFGSVASDGHDSGAPSSQGDGGAKADTGASSGFCNTQNVTFCEDFDEMSFPQAWGTESNIGGSYAVDSTESVSPPNSLLMKFAPSSALNTALRKGFSRQARPNQLDFDFQFKPVSADTASGAVAVIASIDFYDPSRTDSDRFTLQFTLENTLALRLEEQGILADGGSSYVPHEPSIALGSGAWTDVHLSVTTTGGAISGAHVTFNGVTAIDAPLAPTVDAKATDVQITLGGVFESPSSSSWQLAYDNVTLEVLP